MASCFKRSLLTKIKRNVGSMGIWDCGFWLGPNGRLRPWPCESGVLAPGVALLRLRGFVLRTGLRLGPQLSRWHAVGEDVRTQRHGAELMQHGALKRVCVCVPGGSANSGPAAVFAATIARKLSFKGET